MKIDIFPHVLPAKYREALAKKLPPAAFKPFEQMFSNFPALTDLDSRFFYMDKHKDMVQVINITVPFVEQVLEPKIAVEMAKMGNDELAEIVAKYPDRFVAAMGSLPMNDMDAALDELDRIINKLNFRGIQICTDIAGKPLDAPEFMPLYEKMEKYDLPILLHPARPATVSDYRSEETSKYKIFHILGWPYDTSAAMMRLVFSQVLQKYPGLKFITHHCGAMIPYFEQRIATFCRDSGMKEVAKGLKKQPLEYFKMIYADTALGGSVPALMCAYAFFGAEHILFGTDMPYGCYPQHSGVDDTVNSIEKMGISDAEKEKIFSGNAMKLFKLKV